MLRDFRPEDQEALKRLVEDGLRERWGDTYDRTANPDTDDFTASYLLGGGEIVLAEVDGRLVGSGIVVAEGSAARLLRISVDSRFRRRGIARAVVGELVGRARSRGLSPVRVSTDVPWTDAIELYRSCGFVEVGRDEVDVHLELAPENP